MEAPQEQYCIPSNLERLRDHFPRANFSFQVALDLVLFLQFFRKECFSLTIKFSEVGFFSSIEIWIIFSFSLFLETRLYWFSLAIKSSDCKFDDAPSSIFFSS
jgi:hypothetical protein